MSTIVWIVTVVITIAFLAAGLTKVIQPRDKLLDRMAWVNDFSQAQVRGIGAVEVLGALGLVLPAWTGIAPMLVPLAATGLAVAMLLAVLMHLRRGDGVAAAVPSLILAVLAAFVAWARFGPYPL